MSKTGSPCRRQAEEVTSRHRCAERMLVEWYALHVSLEPASWKVRYSVWLPSLVNNLHVSLQQVRRLMESSASPLSSAPRILHIASSFQACASFLWQSIVQSSSCWQGYHLQLAWKASELMCRIPTNTEWVKWIYLQGSISQVVRTTWTMNKVMTCH